jgi:ribonuclease HI
LWSLVIDDLLVELNGSGGIYAQGYADDIFILVKGKFPCTVLEVFQRSLNIVQNFCNNVGLSVNPAKTTVIPFTRKYKVGDLRTPTMYGQGIEFSNESKYLGVMLDSKLSWNAHIDFVVSKATRSFWASRKIVGKNWGLKPGMMHWLYEQIILPRITYGSIVWWHKLKQVNAGQKIEKLQRMAELAICGAWKTTPKLALDRLLELPPLQLRVEAVAQASACRLVVNKLWVYDWIFTGHLEMNRFLRGISLYTLETDYTVPNFVFEKPFEIVLSEDDITTGLNETDSKSLCLYTDASKSEKGVGIGVFSEELNISFGYKLQDHASVFQAEVQALCKAINYCLDLNIHGRKICLLTDSKSALLALNNVKVKSLTVSDCISNLIALGQENEVTLKWIKGHSGIEGNEMADELAKEAAKKETYDENVRYSLDIIKSDIHEWLQRQHFRIWNSSDGAMTAKSLIGPKRKNKLTDVLRLSRNDLSILIGALTGHMSINSFLFKLNLTNSKICRFCGEHEETIIHILCRCRTLCGQRRRHFGEDFRIVEQMRKQDYSDIISFIKDIGITL